MGIGDRLDEAKGKAKEGVGKLTGDKRMEREGKAEATAAKTKREVKGAGRQVGGAVKEKVGQITGDEPTEAEGRAERLRGKAERTG